MPRFMFRLGLLCAFLALTTLSLSACGGDDIDANQSPNASENDGNDNDGNDNDDQNNDCQVDCDDGDTRCDGADIETCVVVDGCPRWSDPAACDGDQVCSGDQCVDECTDQCTDGQTRCDGDTEYQTCEMQSTGCLDWSSPDSCPDAGACEDGSCTGCIDGTRRCAGGGAIEECSDDDWSQVQQCSIGCEDAACTSEVSCSPGEYQCNQTVVEVCNASGSAYLPVSTCAVDCANGLCTGECTPDEQRCNGDDVEICNDDGTAWDFVRTCNNRCDSVMTDCAEQELELTSDTTLDGVVVVDGPVTIHSGVDVTSPTGELTIIASSITVEEDGAITMTSTGDYPEGRGDNGTNCSTYYRSGGAGASYGSSGTSNVYCWGVSSPTPHARDDEIEVVAGSRGGHGVDATAAVGQGGLGGGVLHLRADQIDISGTLRADGDDGVQGNCTVGSGAGGSGGGILVAADDLSVTGTVSVLGGDGHPTSSCRINRSGDGGDGVVKFLYGTDYENTANIQGVSYEGLLAPLEIGSSSHPDSTLYFNDDFDTIAFSWTQPFASIQGYYHTLNTTRNYVPFADNADFLDDELVTYDREDLSDGVNYFHITAVNAQFEVGQMEARLPIHINTFPPSLSSASHPDQHQWSTNNNVNLSWSDQRPEDSFVGYYYTVDHFGDTVPTDNDTFVPIDQKQTILSSQADGIWAFHIVPVDTMGYLTKSASTYVFRIGDDPGAGTVLGTVTDDSGNAIEGATVTVNRGLLHPAVSDEQTNTSGSYNLGDVPTGSWEIRVSADGYETKDVTVDVTDGGSHTVDVSLDDE